jgi:hypothetical protein
MIGLLLARPFRVVRVLLDHREHRAPSCPPLDGWGWRSRSANWQSNSAASLPLIEGDVPKRL